MNTFGYIVRRMARSFGFKNERERLVVARREATLLSEAENLLGQITWEHCENLDELSEEFWQIKEIDSKQKKLLESIKANESENARLCREHDKLEDEIEKEITALTDRKSAKMQESLKLMHQAEQLRDQVEHTKRKFSGTKTKYKVLSEEGSDEEQLKEIVAELHRIKDLYTEDKAKVTEISQQIQKIESEAAGIAEEIEASRTKARKRLSTMVTEVGKSSSQVAKLSAHIGSLKRTKKELIYRVGTYLSNNAKTRNPEIRKILAHGKGLVSKIVTLRRSIAFNNLLAGRVD